MEGRGELTEKGHTGVFCPNGKVLRLVWMVLCTGVYNDQNSLNGFFM